MPLIRYEMSDCPRSSAETCTCGRPYGLIDGIEGRREDVLDIPAITGGPPVSVHPNTFHDVLDLIPAGAWQVVAEPTRFRILLPGLPIGFDREQLRQRIAAAVSALGKAPLVRKA